MNSRMIQSYALARTLVFALLFIAGVLIYLPWALGVYDWTSGSRLHWKYLGIVPLAFGAYLGIHCVFAFAWRGHGTPAPFDPPRNLVIEGGYRHVRNPMYWGAFLILTGQGILFGVGWPTAVYIVCFIAATHLFVRFYEEPVLHRKFGNSYDDYCRHVPRWLPRLKVRPFSKKS
jgi:protein-S-isoprenylcysteine O-methyltransferase Ste14